VPLRQDFWRILFLYPDVALDLCQRIFKILHLCLQTAVLCGWLRHHRGFIFSLFSQILAYKIIKNYTLVEDEKRSKKEKQQLIVQAVAMALLIIGLALHLAPVGFIGLALIIFQTAFMGITNEHHIGPAFEEALPFTALLVVFFAVVAVIHDQHLFTPVIEMVISLKGQTQLVAYYAVNGVLSMISDNVFVATVYITETKTHIIQTLGQIPNIGMTGAELMDKLTDLKVPRADVFAVMEPAAAAQAEVIMTQFDKLAVAINAGTNIPSVATPNGQAAFLFLLTSALAPVIRLSYGRMVMQALPYTITMSLSGLAATYFFL